MLQLWKRKIMMFFILNSSLLSISSRNKRAFPRIELRSVNIVITFRFSAEFILYQISDIGRAVALGLEVDGGGGAGVEGAGGEVVALYLNIEIPGSLFVILVYFHGALS